MEWISSTEFIEMLKRFPNTQIKAKCYGSLNAPTYVWEYQKDRNKFVYLLDGKSKKVTENRLIKHFASDFWRPEPFFALKDEKQRQLAIRIVEHLIMTGNIDWIICECNINFVRECDHCHRLMDEGWLCGDTYKFCCDECLLAENPDITQDDLNDLVVNEDSEICWTEWKD